MNYEVIQANGRKVCIRGVGTSFHSEGFPIGIAAKMLKDKGIELSWYHVAKELYFQYSSNDRLFNKLKAEAEDARIEGIEVDLHQLFIFINTTWENQCEIIFNYLWGGDTEAAKSFFNEQLSHYNK